MIEAIDLRKSYDEVEALQGVSFSIPAGEIIGLLGPNGAGKTTLMKILTGYLQPSGGSATIAGLDIQSDIAAIQELIGYLPENAPLYPELTVQSYLKMIADLRKIPAGKQKERLAAAVEAVGLSDRLTRQIGTLSKGYRQRVGLAQAILHRPRILILDEPTSGLDPTQIVEVRHKIKALAADTTVLLSTHILSEVEATCDRAIIIISGQVRADARLSELAATANAIVELAAGGDTDPAAALQQLPGVETVTRVAATDGRTTYRVHGDSDRNLCPEIYQLARASNWELSELRQEVRTLEAVFNEIAATGGVQ